MASMNTFRGSLYRLVRLLGDVNAIEKGKVPRRIPTARPWPQVGSCDRQSVR